MQFLPDREDFWFRPEVRVFKVELSQPAQGTSPFFFVLGVILFDIVTGIIIDTFGALREETANRDSYKETKLETRERRSLESPFKGLKGTGFPYSEY